MTSDCRVFSIFIVISNRLYHAFARVKYVRSLLSTYFNDRVANSSVQLHSFSCHGADYTPGDCSLIIIENWYAEKRSFGGTKCPALFLITHRLHITRVKSTDEHRNIILLFMNLDKFIPILFYDATRKSQH